MKKSDFVTLCLRLLSIYFGVMGLSSLPQVSTIFIESNRTPVTFAITPFILLIVGILLYLSAPKISRYIIDFSDAEEEHIQISPSEKTARIAFLVLGVFIFANSLPQLIQLSTDIGLYYKDLNKIPESLRTMQHRWTYLIGPVIKLIISIILIVGPDKVFGIMSKYDSSFKRIKSSDDHTEIL